jgi:predicted P-loop ATPase
LPGALGVKVRSIFTEAVACYRQGAIWWFDEPELVAEAKVQQDQWYQTDAWERRRVNHGYGNYDDWRDEESKRASRVPVVN